jgi:quinolinate synthase
MLAEPARADSFVPPIWRRADAGGTALEVAAIRDLARSRNAVILAHNYQLPEVQDAADFVGDSLGLALQAQ